MSRPLIRTSVWALGGVIVAVVLVVAALPMIASTQIVRDRIALELSAWTGYRVEFGATPDIEIWPTFRANLTDVKMSDWADAGHQPVIEAERIEVGLSALAALGGNAVFSDARLLRPIIHVTPAGNLLYAPELPEGGRIARSIGDARVALADNATEPDLSRLPNDSFGMVEFVDGQVVVSRAAGDVPVMTSLSGTFTWPALNRGATLTASAIWRGETVKTEGSLAQPLLLFGGGASSLTMNLNSTPFSASFDGSVNFSANAFLDGQFSVAAPSLRRLLEWSASDIVAASATGGLALSGRAVGDLRRIKVEDAELALDGNPGTGLLEFALSGDVPAVSGTLAFQDLNLSTLLYAFTPLSPGTAAAPVVIDAASVAKFNLDLRLSADRASAGPISLSAVAATLQVKDNLTAFDISDATAFGGTVQTGVRYNRDRDGGYLETSLLATDLEAGIVAAAAKIQKLVPTGRATVSVILKGPGKDWESFMQTAEGSVSAGFGPGSISGFNLTTFLKRIGEGGFFPLEEVADGSLPVERADLKASVGNGIARLEKADIATGRHLIRLSGIVPHVGRGLALSGSVDARAGASEAPEPLARFFVGGAWSAPFVSPVGVSLTAKPAPAE